MNETALYLFNTRISHNPGQFFLLKIEQKKKSLKEKGKKEKQNRFTLQIFSRLDNKVGAEFYEVGPLII